MIEPQSPPSTEGPDSICTIACSPSTVLLRLDESELVDASSAATVVVLPFVKILDSASALLAPSLGRRVRVPDVPTFRELRSEVGEQWVHLFVSARPMSDELSQAIADPPTGYPDLGDHEWSNVSERTLKAYRSTIDRRRGS